MIPQISFVRAEFVLFALRETHYRDRPDMEFTIERIRLWMLRTRKPPGAKKTRHQITVDIFSALPYLFLFYNLVIKSVRFSPFLPAGSFLIL